MEDFSITFSSSAALFSLLTNPFFGCLCHGSVSPGDKEAIQAHTLLPVCGLNEDPWGQGTDRLGRGLRDVSGSGAHLQLILQSVGCRASDVVCIVCNYSVNIH